MARNKHPEETVHKILKVSYRLFREKGYDHTTIQDIVDELGMSKGAVYHHFNSKEDILDRINDNYYDEVKWFKEIRLDKQLTALEKLRAIMLFQFVDRRKHELDNINAPLLNNPKLIALVLTSSVNDAAPFFRQLIEEGVQDGSIQVEQPQELTEALMILLNMWVGMFSSNRENFLQKLHFMQQFTKQFGLPIFDEELCRAGLAYYDQVMAKSQGLSAEQRPG